ncbi:DUF1642 domain-containing protein [Enterococcus avium]|uniref:DUF1642 domain-containing protein n=1 Tax=Enterococcus avium TaxID=33945 RepID=UPI00288D3C1D|nr:DUF1642 domain-containing protein [Enterococcus avium]MDT2398665.1 DUF1642 domain-containing protein [Enterococcus avium]
MNKQDKKKLTKHIELNQHMTEISMFGRTAVVDVVPSDRLIDLIDELASPVKVPKFVGELLDYYRNSTDVDLLALLICFKGWYFRKDKLNENEEAIDWLVKHPEKFMKAWIDGYEVEEEPKYRVNIGGLYLKEPLADTNDFTISMTWNKDYAYPFDSWNMAREHTSELGGTVEKV